MSAIATHLNGALRNAGSLIKALQIGFAVQNHFVATDRLGRGHNVPKVDSCSLCR